MAIKLPELESEKLYIAIVTEAKEHQKTDAIWGKGPHPTKRRWQSVSIKVKKILEKLPCLSAQKRGN